MKQITVRQMLQIHDQLQKGIPTFMELFFYGKINEFYKSCTQRIKTAQEKINTLQQQYFIIEDGKIKEEPVFEENTTTSPKKIFGLTIASKTKIAKIQTGSKPIPSGNMTEQQYIEQMNTIFNEKITL